MELGNMWFGNSRGEFSVDRDWEDVFLDFLDECGFDGDGYADSLSGSLSEDWFDNGVFVVRPYYWGADEKLESLPNFEFKSNGFELSWYKRPLRDAYMNRDISFSEFEQMLKVCRESV